MESSPSRVEAQVKIIHFRRIDWMMVGPEGLAEANCINALCCNVGPTPLVAGQWVSVGSGNAHEDAEADEFFRVTWDEIEALSEGFAEAHPFPRVRWIMALAFLWSLPMREREEIMETALDGGVPWPPAFTIDLMGWARDWSESQPNRVRKAYALASFEALPSADQRKFLAYVTRGPTE